MPEMPFKDVVGNADNAVPGQIAATALKVGVTVGLTLMVSVVVVAHWPAFGVKV